VRKIDKGIKGIRGAIDVEVDEPQAIFEATKKLLKKILEVNNLQKENIINVFFTATHDLKSAYPARAARDMGWTMIPMMCLQEMEVIGSLPRCIRVLLQVEGYVNKEVKHVYLGKAQQLRPDLSKSV
jgi:chorismate mutase